MSNSHVPIVHCTVGPVGWRVAVSNSTEYRSNWFGTRLANSQSLAKKELIVEIFFAASFACEIQEWADSVNSGQSLAGRILVVFVWLCNLMSMVSFLQLP